MERTIGIDTDYIETNDFNLESEDKKFLVEVSPSFSFRIKPRIDQYVNSLLNFNTLSGKEVN